MHACMHAVYYNNVLYRIWYITYNNIHKDILDCDWLISVQLIPNSSAISVITVQFSVITVQFFVITVQFSVMTVQKSITN